MGQLGAPTGGILKRESEIWSSLTGTGTYICVLLLFMHAMIHLQLPVSILHVYLTILIGIPLLYHMNA
ncbi:hypothetical protein Scep_016473 [Stephania cephalantha]|uniref:Uncharacterized protein n=1 Tax=Stephania cephalantha TaxID=152367 RepID=A0AAP0INI8_9MAGN